MKILKKYIIMLGSKSILTASSVKSKILKKKKTRKHNTTEKDILETILEENTKTPKNEKKKKNTYIIIVILLILSINFQTIRYITLILLLAMILRKIYPNIKEEQRRKDILKNLPFALRQLSTELKAGIGLMDALKTISTSQYGELSKEFTITLEEIYYGTSYNEAFNNLSKRTKTDIMDRIIQQILKTLNNGGNLADTLNKIADENSNNMRIKYKEYSEKLNSIMLIYMFIAVLIPVIMFIMIIAATTVIGPIMNPNMIMFMYLLLFPMIITLMIIFIKRLEPTL